VEEAAMRPNPVKEKLARGGVALGTMVFEFASPGLPAILAGAGAEFALYDMEHSGFTMAEMKQQFAACRGIGVVPLVRPPEKSYAVVARLLDIGAMGLMLQMVDTPEEAARIVSWTRYPPDGVRGAMFGGAHDDYVGGSLDAKMAAVTARTLVLPMIETRAGLDAVEEILAVPGVDGVHLGQFDLSLQLGLPGRFEHPQIEGAIDRILAACRRHGKFAGCMAPTLEVATTWLRRGFTMISYSHDIGLLSASLGDGLARIRQHAETSAADLAIDRLAPRTGAG
jgi:2-dehydro-3-deoxyglucarate aldolase/4-hydroxy-2-oxoheptanedioate aldolase